MQRNWSETASSAFFDMNAALSSLKEVMDLKILSNLTILSTLNAEYGIGKKKPR